MLDSRKQKTNWHKWLILIVVTGILWPGVAYQAGFVGCNPTPGVDEDGNPSIINQCYFSDLLAVPAGIFNWILGLAGLVFLGIIVWGGARMMLFYASDAPEAELANAKLTIRRGIFGFLIIAFSYLIVWTLVYTIFGLDPSSGVGGFLSTFGLGP